jgi:hypothetical protein
MHLVKLKNVIFSRLEQRDRPPADPTFLVIGTQKCGTTWLFRRIRQHPDVYVRKEIHFFNNDSYFRRSIQWYKAQFSGHSGQRAVGEVATNYFWTDVSQGEARNSGHLPNVPARVKQYYPDLRFILTLRDPVERAISAYYHHIRARRVHPSTPISEVWHRYGILSMGFYDQHLKNWLNYFPREQFLVLILEDDIARRPQSTIRRVYEFIGVDGSFQPDNLRERRNVRANPFFLRLNYRIPLLPRLLRRIVPVTIQNLPLWDVSVREEEKEELQRIYESHNRGLEKMLGRELPWGEN